MSGKTGTTESHRSSGFVGFTNRYAAANYIYADSSTPSGICSFPLRACGSGDLYGGNEPARTWFEAMKPIATDFGDVHLPPTDPLLRRGRAGRPGAECVRAEARGRASAPQGSRVPGRRPADAGEQLSALWHRRGDLAERSNLPRIDHHDQHQQRDCAGTAATSGRAPAGHPTPSSGGHACGGDSGAAAVYLAFFRTATAAATTTTAATATPATATAAPTRLIVG